VLLFVAHRGKDPILTVMSLNLVFCGSAGALDPTSYPLPLHKGREVGYPGRGNWKTISTHP